MQELLNELMKDCKTLKQVEKGLTKNHISYEYHDGFSGKEIHIEDENDPKKYYRILKGKPLRIIKMKRLKVGVDIFTPESKLKAQLIQEALSYK